MIKNIIEILKSFSGQYWAINLVQFFEKAAWWIIIIQIPIYIAQKDSMGGLHWEQSTKGIIYLIWIIVQNLSPIFFGAIADRIGQKKTLITGNLLVMISYLLLPFARDYISFTLVIIGVGLGSALIKPSTLGVVSNQLSKKNEAFGWSLYVLLLNFAVFSVSPFAKYLKDISWHAVFWGAAGIMLLQLLAILFIKNEPSKEAYNKLSNKKSLPISQQFKELFAGLFQPNILRFILPISGFTMIYMQFYETLPHFIYDWSDTSQIASLLSLPDNMTSETARGSMISFQYLYMINPLLTTLFILVIAYFVKRVNKIKVIIVGVSFVSLGWMLTASSMEGSFLILGMIVYSFGEMTTNPKLTEFMSSLSPDGKKSTFMGYLSLSYLIGYSVGAIFGGYTYQYFGEKATLASNYLIEHYGLLADKTNSFDLLMQKMTMSPSELTAFLWDYYSPWVAWLPFFAIGLISIVELYFYMRKYSKYSEL